MSKYMYYCFDCNKLYRAGDKGKQFMCSKCSKPVVDMGISSEEYEALDEKQRQLLKEKAVKSNENELVAEPPYIMYLCPECRKVYKAKGNGKIIKCKNCNDVFLIDSKEKYDKWTTYTPEQKNELIDRVAGKKDISEKKDEHHEEVTPKISFFDEKETLAKKADTPVNNKPVKNKPVKNKNEKPLKKTDGKRIGIIVGVIAILVVVVLVAGIVITKTILSKSDSSADAAADNADESIIEDSNDSDEEQAAQTAKEEGEDAVEQVQIDPAHLELLFETKGENILSSVTDETYPKGLDLQFDSQKRLVYLTAYEDDLAIYGVQTGGYASDYTDALFDAGWMLHSGHLWREQQDGEEWHTMISTVYKQDDQELVLTGDIKEEAAKDEDYRVTRITLLSCPVVDEIADTAGVQSYVDYAQTKVFDVEDPEAKKLSDTEDGTDGYRLSCFYKLLELEGQ